MSETALIRCECGVEIEFTGGEVACPRCGKVYGGGAKDSSLMDTVAMEKGGSRAAPAVEGPAGMSTGTGSAGGGTLVGQSLDHFRILEKLGKGGVGTVYRALDTSLDREVALKVLNEEGESQALETFAHEARAQARLNHPGIATIYYIGRRGESPYFAMEYVPILHDIITGTWVLEDRPCA